jgi:hypothetical protein
LGEENVQILTDEAFIGVRDETPFAYSSQVEVTGQQVEDRLEQSAIREEYRLISLWEGAPVEGLQRFRLMAGSTLYGSGPGGKIFAMDCPGQAAPPVLRWTEQVDGEVFSMLAARGRLFVVTEEGAIYCFGPEARPVLEYPYLPVPRGATPDEWTLRAQNLLAEPQFAGGYALMLGAGSGRLMDELLAQSELHITVIEPEPVRAEGDAAPLGRCGPSRHAGRRVSGRSRFLPYPAVHRESNRFGRHRGRRIPRRTGLSRSIVPDASALRRHGLVAASARAACPIRPSSGAGQSGKRQWAAGPSYVRLQRAGQLPGAGQWTHQYSDAANTNYSPDQRVKAPLGITWFGSTSNEAHLPRHMNGPVPQVVAGRLVILGLNHLSAKCVYTGRLLWQVELPLVGENFTSLEHEAQPAPVYFPNHPGANFIGSPYASTPDSVYIVYEDQCRRLDLDTGETLSVFTMPSFGELVQHARAPVMEDLHASYAARLEEGEEGRQWGYIGVWDDLLIAGAYPHMFTDEQPGRENNWNATSSEFLVAMNRETGEIQWIQQAAYGFRHNAIVTAAGRTFVMDNLSQELLDTLGGGASSRKPHRKFAHSMRTPARCCGVTRTMSSGPGWGTPRSTMRSCRQAVMAAGARLPMNRASKCSCCAAPMAKSYGNGRLPIRDPSPCTPVCAVSSPGARKNRWTC